MATKKEDDLVKDAEIAMYHAKRLGGDRIEVLRGLQLDPKQARRLRAERAKGKLKAEP